MEAKNLQAVKEAAKKYQVLIGELIEQSQTKINKSTAKDKALAATPDQPLAVARA